jgi:phosphotriesterase-related protein
MFNIMTVTGSIEAQTLGVTTMHDHVLAYLTPFFYSGKPDCNQHSYPINLDKSVSMEDLCYLNQLGLRDHNRDNWDISDINLMQKEVAYFKHQGGQSILEASAPGIRTNITGLREISQSTGVNIIASTGLYVGVSWPTRFRKMKEKEYRKYLLNEIDIGIENTDIKAGHIKTAVRTGDAEEMKFLKVTAEVATQKNLLVSAHSSRSIDPAYRKEMMQLLLDPGLPPEKLLLCHIHFSFWEGNFVSVFVNPDKQYLKLDWAREVLDSGVNICIDCFGEPPEVWDSVRLAGLITLLKEGYEDQIVIGNDVYQKTMTRSFGGFGYCSILDYVIPELKNHGFSQQCIDKITVENAIRMLQYQVS